MTGKVDVAEELIDGVLAKNVVYQYKTFLHFTHKILMMVDWVKSIIRLVLELDSHLYQKMRPLKLAKHFGAVLFSIAFFPMLFSPHTTQMILTALCIFTQ